MAGGKLISTGVEFPDATTQTTSGLPLTGGALTGAVTTTSTFDGRDVAADGVTADAALPKAGGTMTGTIAGFTSTGIDDNATSTAITIDASENVGIGTATPAAGAKAHIYSSTANVDALFVEKTSDEANSALRVKHVSASDSRYIARFENGTNDIMRIGAAGTVTLGIGNLVIGTSGKGIDFSADGNAAGMTSEVLDDYETGTWTPSNSFTTSTGTYTKIGNRVFCELYVANWTGDALTTVLDLGSLPFTVVTTFNSPCAYTRMTPRFSGRVYAYNTTATALRLRENNNGTYDQHVIHSMLQALTGIKMHFNYDVA